ncbi:HAMP domain-containing protein, partial [Enterobacter quasiroggenkampii]|nr:HAMP domain-containing protein [Enterobacter quasiroggenkampii]
IALQWVINNIGSQPVFVMSGCLLFIFSYYQLSRPIVSQFTNISNGLQEMANGNFAVNIQIDSSDELGDIAQRINGVATELDNYLQEITQGLGEIATGELQHEIPVRSAQMLGNVAESINQMSRQLSQSIEEERKAEKTKSDLITGVSHDLRTPLT